MSASMVRKVPAMHVQMQWKNYKSNCVKPVNLATSVSVLQS